MKRNIAVITLVLASFSVALSQIDRSKAPAPGAAPDIKLAEYTSFELKNGLKVYVVENRKLPRVSFSLQIDRDPIMEGEKAGFISIAGQLMGNGTHNRTKSELDEEVDFIGANLSTSSTGVFASSLTKHQDKLLELMADVLYNPSFPEDELEKIKKQTKSSIAASKEDPNSIAANVRSVLLYGKDHPYGEVQTEESIDMITGNDCRTYYSEYFKPNKAFLAIVGDIDVKSAKKLVNKYFGKWERGEVSSHSYKEPNPPEQTFVAMVDRPSSVQSVINVTYPLSLTPGSEDVIKARVTNHILGGGFSSRLMQNLREDKGFTYGARSSLSSDRLVGSFLASASVRNEVTDSSVFEFMTELRKMKSEKVSNEELDAAKAYLTGSFARSLESPQTIAGFAINIARYNLPEDYYSTYLKKLNGVTLDDIQNMAVKYVNPDQSYILVVGKASEVANGLKKFGAVRYFDFEGNEYVPSDSPEIPEGLTAETVLNNYLEAIGGREKLRSVSSVSITMKAETMGRELDMSVVEVAPNKSRMELSMGGMVVQKMIFDGENMQSLQMGQEVPVDEKTKTEQALENGPFAELYYSERGISAELAAIEKVDDQFAYAIIVTLPTGTESTEYYSTDTGLKIRVVKSQQTPQGELNQISDFADYREVEGVLFPFSIIQTIGPTQIKAVVETLEVNKDVPSDTFVIE